MSAPIFADPILDGAADPTVIKKRGTNEWWMFYTNRRATFEGPGVQWVHGSPIGIAVSTDGGRMWHYYGTVDGLDDPDAPGTNTHWAPEVIWAEGAYHMFLSYIVGTPDRWEGYPRHIVHFVSDDLIAWKRIGPIPLSSDFVIDAAVTKCPDGLYRLWYKDEGNESGTAVATSSDLFDWSFEGVAIPPTPGHEGPNVFNIGGWWWMVVDEWRGLGVFRSTDAIAWERQGLILDRPGSNPLDKQIGRHASVVVRGDWAALFYFTHPYWSASHAEQPTVFEERRSTIHWARLTVEDDRLVCRRDVDPEDLDLDRLDKDAEPKGEDASPAPVRPRTDDRHGTPSSRALQKPRVHAATVRQLAMRIVSGDYAPGDALPVEASLCTDLGVSRSALREAVRVLTEKGLLAPRPRIGTLVRPRADWNVLDPEMMNWLAESGAGAGFLADATAARLHLEPEVAEWASRHATGQDLMRLEEALARMTEAASIDDITAYVAADADFHRALMQASHNEIYARMTHLIGVTADLCLRVNIRHGYRPADAIAFHARLIDHIRLREARPACQAAERLLAPGTPLAAGDQVSRAAGA